MEMFSLVANQVNHNRTWKHTLVNEKLAQVNEKLAQVVRSLMRQKGNKLESGMAQF